jgi:hypothetical protein
MPTTADDWRRQGQERHLPPGTVLIRTHYRQPSATWDHDHCEFCWARFMERDPGWAEPVLTEGYTTTAEHPHGAESHWVCPECAADFAEELEWRLVDS